MQTNEKSPLGLRIVASGIPASLSEYQVALDCAFAAGRAVGRHESSVTLTPVKPQDPYGYYRFPYNSPQT